MNNTEISLVVAKKHPHRGDPCEYCGIPHDDVPPGPCEVSILNAAEELRLWRWIHEEMQLHMVRNADESQPWVVADVDGEAIAFGDSMPDALQKAEKRILQMPGHECI